MACEPTFFRKIIVYKLKIYP